MARDDASWIQIILWPLIILGFYLRNLQLRNYQKAIDRGDGLPDIATAVDGEVARDPSFDAPFVRFTVDGVRCYLHRRMLNRTTRSSITTLEVRAGFRGFLQATSEGSIRYPASSSRFHPLPALEGFRIVTTDLEWSGEVLRAGLRKILEALHRVSGGAGRLQISGDHVTVETESRLSHEGILGLSALARRLITLAKASASSPGIDFQGDVAVSLAGRCPVCCQTLAPSPLRCANCAAPHHADCWEYWGRCAIFGCSGRRAA
ncbi:MAG TPA: hypothetical protein VE981_13400 [Planctomycetota bacterium]|nr:hypothetical protein [Planctomycetota bacterium]